MRCTTFNPPDIFPKENEVSEISSEITVPDSFRDKSPSFFLQISFVFDLGMISMMDIELEEKSQSFHLFKLNAKSTVRIWPNIDGFRRYQFHEFLTFVISRYYFYCRLVIKKIQLNKRIRVNTKKRTCDPENGHKIGDCVHKEVEKFLKCHLPWIIHFKVDNSISYMLLLFSFLCEFDSSKNCSRS